MEKNDWQDQKNNNGSDFMKVVQDAINSGDYQQLNEQVRKTVSASVNPATLRYIQSPTEP